MPIDKLFQLVVGAIADLFDTPAGQKLIADLIAYVEGELAKIEGGTGGATPTTPAPTPAAAQPSVTPMSRGVPAGRR